MNPLPKPHNTYLVVTLISGCRTGRALFAGLLSVTLLLLCITAEATHIGGNITPSMKVNNIVASSVPERVVVSLKNNGTATIPTHPEFGDITVRLLVFNDPSINLDTDANVDNDTKTLPPIAPGETRSVVFYWTPYFGQGVDHINATLTYDGTQPLVGAFVTVIEPGPELFCEGFYAPFDQDLSLKNKAKGAIPVMLELWDGPEALFGGGPVTAEDLVSPPVINVTFNSTLYGGDSVADDAALEPVGNSNEGNALVFNPDSGLWEYRLSTKPFSSVGTYTVSVKSGDLAEYVIPPWSTCQRTFTRQP